MKHIFILFASKIYLTLQRDSDPQVIKKSFNIHEGWIKSLQYN